MHVPAEVRKRVEAKLHEGIAKAEAFYNRKFKMPSIDYNLRGRTAGTAHGPTNHLSFNATLLMENLEDFIDDNTVPHELAHLIDYIVNPQNHESEIVWTRRGPRRTKRDVHGADFKFIMETVLGTSQSNRCHTYDTTNSTVSKTMYMYKCSCGCDETSLFSGKRHNAILRGATYWKRESRHARSPMVFVRVVRPGESTELKPTSIQRPTPVPVAASQARPTPVARPSSTAGMSTKDIARRIYSTASSRSDFISQMEAHGIKKTTASTYYQNFNSGTWK